VVARGRDVWAIEVKSGRSGKASGLTRFRDRYPEARALLVGGQGIPLETFSIGMQYHGWFDQRTETFTNLTANVSACRASSRDTNPETS